MIRLTRSYLCVNSLVDTKRQDKSAGQSAKRARMKIAKAEPQPKQLRKQAGDWLKELRGRAGLSQIQLADVLGFKYYTFISQL